MGEAKRTPERLKLSKIESVGGYMAIDLGSPAELPATVDIEMSGSPSPSLSLTHRAILDADPLDNNEEA